MVEGARRSENLTRPLRRVRTGQKNGRRSGVPSARGIVLTFFFNNLPGRFMKTSLLSPAPPGRGAS